MNPNNHLRRTLRELAQLQPSDDAAARAVAATRAALSSDAGDDSAATENLLMMYRRTSIAAAACIVALAAGVWMFASDRTGNVAFAQVVEQLERVKTVRYTETRSSLPRPGEPTGPSTVTKYWVLGRSQQRQEVVSFTDGDPLPDGAVWAQARVGMASVSNLATGEVVSLDTQQRTYSRVKAFMSIDRDSGELTETKPRPMPEVDFYRRIREFPADEAQRLPQQEIAGVQAVGFRTVETTNHPGGVDTWTRTYWINAKSNLPVQLEVTFESTQPTMGQLQAVLSEIVFDQPLDESLLSTEPPEGYAVVGE